MYQDVSLSRSQRPKRVRTEAMARVILLIVHVLATYLQFTFQHFQLTKSYKLMRSDENS